MAAANAPPAGVMRTNSSLWDHLSELRQTLIYCLIMVALGMALCLFYYQEIFALVTKPLQVSQKVELRRERLYNRGKEELIYVPKPSETVYGAQFDGKIPPGSYIDIESPVQNSLLLLSPTEGMLTAFKICFWLGLVVSSPFWGTFLLRFVLPALYPHEKRLLVLFLGGTVAALCAGFCFAYLVTIPLANQYLEAFNSSIGRNFWTLSHYLDFTLMLMIANGFAFEIGLALFFLVHVGLLSAGWMIGKRRHMIVLAFILGALLTPPDVPTQLMLAIPLIGLYELAIVYARLRHPNVD